MTLCWNHTIEVHFCLVTLIYTVGVCIIRREERVYEMVTILLTSKIFFFTNAYVFKVILTLFRAGYFRLKIFKGMMHI